MARLPSSKRTAWEPPVLWWMRTRISWWWTGRFTTDPSAMSSKKSSTTKPSLWKPILYFLSGLQKWKSLWQFPSKEKFTTMEAPSCDKAKQLRTFTLSQSEYYLIEEENRWYWIISYFWRTQIGRNTKCYRSINWFKFQP